MKYFLTSFISASLLIGLFKIEAKSAKPPVQVVEAFLPCSHEIFWWAVMQAESSGNPRCVYHESFGIDSLGLFQVSFEDAARYACPFKTREDAFDPLKNTICKDLIVERLRKLHPTESWSRVLGRYWSSLRDKSWGKEYSGYKHFKAYALQKGCQIP